MMPRTVSCLAAAALLAVVAVQASAGAETTIVVAPGSDVVEPLEPARFAKAEVQVRPIATQLVTNGTVAWDVSRAVPVNCFTNGRAIDVRTRLGDEVTRDQLLLTVDSPDLGAALSTVRSTTSTLSLKQKAYERARRLYAIGAGAMKDVEQSADDVKQAEVALSVARERVHQVGADPDQKQPLLEVRAPSSGAIVEQNIQRGGLVKSLDASSNLFTIADLSAVWVLCDLYENQLPEVAVGDTAEVTLSAYPDRTIPARVAHISKVLDTSSRTAKVRLELPNRDGILRPGMFATVRFTSGRPTEHAVIPATAVLRLHDKAWVFRRETEKQWRRVEIDPGRILPDGSQEVKKGLARGETVIVDALQFATSAEQEKEGQ